MCAHACWPALGSELGAGWAWACAAAREHEVWVLTHSANATAIEAVLAEDDSLARLRPVYLHNTGRVGSLSRRGPARFLYYVVSMTRAWSAKRLPALSATYQWAAGSGAVREVMR
jgi:hypothetical protein